MLLVVLAVTWLGPSASAQVGDLTDGVGDAVGDVGDTVGGTTGGATDTVTDTVGGTTDTVNGTVGGATGSVGGSVGGTVGGTTDTVTGTVGDTTGGVGGAVGDATDTVTETVGGGSGSPVGGSGPSSGNDRATNGTDGSPASGAGEGSGAGDGTDPATPGTTVITLPDGTTIVVPTLKGSVDGRKLFDNSLSSEAAAALRGLVDGFAGATPPGTAVASSQGADDQQGSLSFADNASRVATQVAKTLAFPLMLAGLVVGFLALQGRLGRKDPKLVAAPVHAEENSLTFR